MPKSKPKPAKRKTLPEGHFSVWVTLPVDRRGDLGAAAGRLAMPMSEFARRAILEALRRFENGGPPFPERE